MQKIVQGFLALALLVSSAHVTAASSATKDAAQPKAGMSTGKKVAGALVVAGAAYFGYRYYKNRKPAEAGEAGANVAEDARDVAMASSVAKHFSQLSPALKASLRVAVLEARQTDIEDKERALQARKDKARADALAELEKRGDATLKPDIDALAQDKASLAELESKGRAAAAAASGSASLSDKRG